MRKNTHQMQNSAGGSVNWYSHCEKQYGGVPEKNYYMIQQSYIWEFITRK